MLHEILMGSRARNLVFLTLLGQELAVVLFERLGLRNRSQVIVVRPNPKSLFGFENQTRAIQCSNPPGSRSWVARRFHLPLLHRFSGAIRHILSFSISFVFYKSSDSYEYQGFSFSFWDIRIQRIHQSSSNNSIIYSLLIMQCFWELL